MPLPSLSGRARPGNEHPSTGPYEPASPVRVAGRSRRASYAGPAAIRYSPGVVPNHLRNARWKPTELW